IYAANHGMEIFYNGRHLLKKGHAYKRPIRILAGALRDSMSGISGAIVEYKGLSVAVHYRKVNAKFHTTVKKLLKNWLHPM
ncbi:MAG: hypothetical protein HY877_09325, partial [Deltaproteobacteria bacterium]|nr:hypothetical protein [Deltaproteobacteria bacterium]